MTDFARESEMAPPVRAWLEAQGLTVKAEVSTRHGTCDLVGCSINPEKARTRVAMRKATVRTLVQCARLLEEGVDWLPVHDRLVFVELKLSRVAEVFHQAYRHKYLSESYAALPLVIAERQAGKDRWTRHGIGLLGVTPDEVRVFVPATELDGEERFRWQQVSIAERFWKTRDGADSELRTKRLAASAAERTE